MKTLAVLPALLYATTSLAQTYQCVPEIKYSCARAECTRETDGFQHAESFTYDAKAKQISACLWTNCYSGKATTTFRDPATGATTVVGVLGPSAHPGNAPILLSLTIDKQGGFTVTWDHRGEGATMGVGRCQNAPR